MTKNILAVIGFSGSTEQADSTFNLSRHVGESGHHKSSGEGLILREADREGGLKLCLLLNDFSDSGRPSNSSIVVNPKEDVAFHVSERGHSLAEPVAQRRMELSSIVSDDLNDFAESDNKFMLILNIKPMNSIKQFIPAVIWIKLIDCSLGVLAGDVYLSLSENRFKGVSVLPERELDALRICCYRADNPKGREIQGSAQVVNRIADYEGKFIWDGLLGLDANGVLCACWLAPNNRFERFLGQELSGLRVKIMDVMYGPLNLQPGRVP